MSVKDNELKFKLKGMYLGYGSKTDFRWMKFIRDKYRVYLHLTIEGKTKPKYDKLGNPRH